MLGIMNSVIRTATLSDEPRARWTPRSRRAETERSERRMRRALRLAGLK
jgi:hypothetical protein